MSHQQPRFLNVDLDLCSSKEMNALLKDLGERVVVLTNDTDMEGVHWSTLEVGDIGTEEYETGNPTVLSTMQDFDTLLQTLSPAARAELDAATVVFDVGYDYVPEVHNQQFDLPAAVLQIALKYNGCIRVTLYQLDKATATV